MQCEKCQASEATVHLTQVTGEGVRKMHLCESCAEQSGIDVHDAASLADALLVGLGEKEARPAERGRSCSRCHVKTSDFKRTGRLGCPDCYATFRNELRPLVRSMHRAERHAGKRPAAAAAAAGWPAEREGLQRALADAVAREAFEEAAQIRDRLRRLGPEDRDDGIAAP